MWQTTTPNNNGNNTTTGWLVAIHARVFNVEQIMAQCCSSAFCTCERARQRRPVLLPVCARRRPNQTPKHAPHRTSSILYQARGSFGVMRVGVVAAAAGRERSVRVCVSYAPSRRSVCIMFLGVRIYFQPPQAIMVSGLCRAHSRWKRSNGSIAASPPQNANSKAAPKSKSEQRRVF